jgi:hypothetical protein
VNPNIGTITGNVISNLFAGVYEVCVTDANMCTVCHLDTVFNDPLSVATLNSINTLVYPNPSHGNFTISASYLLEDDAFIQIFDAQGKLILEKRNPGQSVVEIQTVTIGPGMYILTSGTASFTRFRTRLILFN